MIKLDASKKFKNLILFIAPVMLLLQSCSHVEVTSDYDKSTNFSSFKTFSVQEIQIGNRTNINEFEQQRIINAITSEMEARGYTNTALNADLNVVAHLDTKDKRRMETQTTYGVREATTRFNAYEYTEGTLRINVRDGKTQKLFWQGVGTSIVDESAKNKEKRVNNTVDKIFAKYPLSKNEKDKQDPPREIK